MVSVNEAERDGIGTQIHLALAVADGERRPVARADHQIVVARENEPERERAAKLRQGRLDRLNRRKTIATDSLAWSPIQNCHMGTFF